jgi:hypothetical protein
VLTLALWETRQSCGKPFQGRRSICQQTIAGEQVPASTKKRKNLRSKKASQWKTSCFGCDF